MLESILNKEDLSGYRVYAICVYKEQLCVIPCDCAMSGDYPVYDKRVVLSEKEIFTFPNKIKGQTIDAIIIRRYNDGFEFDFAEDSWGGFQPIGDL